MFPLMAVNCSSSVCCREARDTLLLILRQVLLTEPHHPAEEAEDASCVFLSTCTSILVTFEALSLVLLFLTIGETDSIAAIATEVLLSVGLRVASNEAARASFFCVYRCKLLIRVDKAVLMRWNQQN
jgi:hypothetical protein